MNTFIKNYLDINLYSKHRILQLVSDDSIWISIYNSYQFHIEFNLYKYDEGILCFRIINTNYDGTGHPYECEYTYNINTDELEENAENEFNVLYNGLQEYVNNNKDFIKIIVMLRKYIYEYIH